MHTDITNVIYDLYRPYGICAALALVTTTLNNYNEQFEHIIHIITSYNTEI